MDKVKSQQNLEQRSGTDVLNVASVGGQSGAAFESTGFIAGKESFSAHITFSMDKAQKPGGLAFVLAADPSQSGAAGKFLGYGGIKKSFAVEFDAQKDAKFNDPNGNHIGIDVNGSVRPVSSKPVSPLLDSGATWHAWIDYSAAEKQVEVRLSADETRPEKVSFTYGMDLAGVFGDARVFAGITAGGPGVTLHDVELTTEDAPGKGTNLIQNGGFEIFPGSDSGEPLESDESLKTLPGWTLNRAKQVSLISPHVPFYGSGVTEGVHALKFASGGLGASVSQRVQGLEAGKSYVISFHQGFDSNFKVFWGGDAIGDGKYHGKADHVLWHVKGGQGDGSDKLIIKKDYYRDAVFDDVRMVAATDSDVEISNSGVKRFVMNGTAATDRVIGGDDAELIRAGSGGDSVFAGAGDDVVYGGNGEDNVQAHGGADRLWEGNDSDSLFGGQGRDVLYGQMGKDALWGESGDDVLDGGKGDDVLMGGLGDDRVSGGKGSDQLDGDAGADLLTGGAGADMFMLRNASSRYAAPDVITDFKRGVDKVTWNLNREIELVQGVPVGKQLGVRLEQDGLTVYDADHTIALTFKGLTEISTDDIHFKLTLKPNKGGTEGQTFTGYTGDDDVTGSEYDDVINGGAGSDRISALWGNDVVNGGTGEDIIWDKGGDDKFNGQGGNDRLYGGDGKDQINGGSGDDVLDGDDDNDTLKGGDGNDRVDGGRGADTLYGGDGNDHFRFDLEQIASSAKGMSTDVIKDFERGKDVIDLRYFKEKGNVNDAPTFAEFGLTSDADAVTISNKAGTFAVRVEGVTGLDASDVLFHRNITGGAGDDVLEGQAGDDFIRDDGGYNRLNGGDGDDVIYNQGEGGILDGGAGADRLFGSDGSDVIAGGAGDDWIESGGGSDKLTGGEGADTFFYDYLFYSLFSAPDVIRDFVSGTDKIILSKYHFDQEVRFDREVRLVEGEPDRNHFGVTKDAGGLTVFNHDHTFALRFEGISDIHDSDFIFS